ncbi:MAG: hypothetical protein HYR94_23000 [Chloroflexi bacterium]|nr:hypothetical protein [Chloroflexota bacterium]
MLIYQCKVSLKGLIPPIWRRVQVTGDIRLDEFHRVLQTVMGWGNYHLYQFIIDGLSYGKPAGLGPAIRSTGEVQLRQVVQVEGQKFIYIYDLAYDWQHVIKVEKILPSQPGVYYPICLAGQRACPPEECGGIFEYSNLLEIFKNPRHPEHREMMEPFGGDFDPEAFDLAPINRALRPIRGTKIEQSQANALPSQWTEEDSGSAEMRSRTAGRLSAFGSRARVEPFDLYRIDDWLSCLEGVDCVVSSLVLHHLDGVEKQRLFVAIGERLSPRGALLIADLIQPQRPEASELFAATWDQSAKAQVQAKADSGHLFEQFVKAEWNYYYFPDPVDKPSPLFDQLTWLKAAGFAVADCFWLQAGHAIYGGYKATPANSAIGVSFGAALRSAQVTLHET